MTPVEVCLKLMINYVGENFRYFGAAVGKNQQSAKTEIEKVRSKCSSV